jgi:hypothetical protein
LSTDLDVMQREIALGIDAKTFMHTTLGKSMQARANREIEAAKDALLEVNPFDGAAVRDLQNKAEVAIKFLAWMGETARAGEQAEEQFILANEQ